MKLLAKIGKIITIFILVPTISLCVLILFFAFTGKKFTPISGIEKTNSTKQESKEESSKMSGENTPEIIEAEPVDIKADSLQKEGGSEAVMPIGDATYVLDVSAFQIHLPDCKLLEEVNFADREDSNDNLTELKENGFVPCETCNPK